MTAYYNEIDPFAVAWLRELIREGVIADGIVDDRSIEVVQPPDLNGFTQCHFFAGIGVWSYGLRRAGWADSRPVWTGSCPCQPFSGAGKGEGFEDPRHLWPSWYRLAREHRPVTIFGEQVERAIRLHWLDLVSVDLEREGYAVGSTVFGSHSVGAPHKRQRLYFVAELGAVPDADDNRRRGGGVAQAKEQVRQVEPSRPGAVGGVPSVALGDGTRGRRRVGGHASQQGSRGHPDSPVVARSLVDDERQRLERHDRYVDHWDQPRRLRAFPSGSTTPSGILSGFWDHAEWVECTDGKARPVEPGSFPLAYGSPARVGRLRGYGNAINAEAAKVFVEAYLSLNRATDR